MLRSLKQKQRKSGRAPKKYIKPNVLLGFRYQNVTILCPPFARWIRVDVPVPTTSLSSHFIGWHLLIYLCNTNGLEPGQDQWKPKALFFLFLKENVCSGYSLEPALSNVNDSFTHSRLIQRPKQFGRHVMSTHNLRFFREIYRNAVSTMFKPIRRRTPTLFKCCSHIFDRITC